MFHCHVIRLEEYFTVMSLGWRSISLSLSCCQAGGVQEAQPEAAGGAEGVKA